MPVKSFAAIKCHAYAQDKMHGVTCEVLDALTLVAKVPEHSQLSHAPTSAMLDSKQWPLVLSCPGQALDIVSVVVTGGRMTVPCEGQLLLLTPPFDGLTPEPIVLGTMKSCTGLVDEHGTQVCSCTPACTAPAVCFVFHAHCPPLHCLDLTVYVNFKLRLKSAPGSPNSASCACNELSLHSTCM